MVSWKVETGEGGEVAISMHGCGENVLREMRKRKRKKKKEKEKERKTKGRRHILSAHAAASPLVGRQKVQKTACN
jgi:hypothetical protein